MIFHPTALADAFLIELEPHRDDRGFFARTFCRQEFSAHGLDATVDQCNVSFSERRGTLRGLHYQAAPHEENKLVRCVRGAIFDAIVDLRAGSPTHRQVFTVTLRAHEPRQLYVPKGFAHGFLTLADDTEVVYQMSTAYVADAAAGYRYDDPAFGIEWPEPVRSISERDLSLPRYGDREVRP